MICSLQLSHRGKFEMYWKQSTKQEKKKKKRKKKKGTDNFLILKYFEFKMVDNLSILDQMHELQVLVNKLCDLSINIPESFQVGAVIAKVPPSWNNYRKKL
jgi:hypothetical protein